MPAHDGVWREDEEMVAPRWSETPSDQPQQLVDESKTGTRFGSRKQGQLMPKEQVFDKESAAISEETGRQR